MRHVRGTTRSWARAGVVASVCLAAACASHRPRTLADRFVRHATKEQLKEPDLFVGPAANPEAAAASAEQQAADPEAGAPSSDAEADLPPAEAIRSVERMGETLETTNPALADALSESIASPSPAAYREVAAAYRRMGVYDGARKYLDRALEIDARDAAAFEERARVWRDEGWPALALGDAHRAVSYAPESASAHNTLGTVRYSLGDLDGARQAFERALAIDPAAAYAHNNLCYVAHLRGDDAAAVRHCEQAIALAPALAAARNNLALAHAAAGRLEEARQAFAAGNAPGVALYNLGIVHLARREYADAAKAFDAALVAAPAMSDAWRRAKEARALADRAGTPQTKAGTHAARQRD